MTKLKIFGKANPVVGVKEYYSVNDFFGNSASGQFTEPKFQSLSEDQIKWSIWVFNGSSWSKIAENNKTGTTVHYTFSQKSLTRKGIRMLVDANGEKAVLDIKTQKTSQSKILHVDLLDRNYNKPTKPFVYGDWIIARVHCVDMERFPLTVTLWEDDGDKMKQNTTNVKIEVKKGTVLNGKAYVAFYLNPSYAWLANAKLAPKDKDEGEFHEYYVTAEIFGKVSKRIPSKNANVPNPDYKPETGTPAPKQSAPVPKKQTPAEKKGPSKKEEKGIFDSVGGILHDYYETSVSVFSGIGENVIEKINSLMTVDVGDKKEEKKDECPNCNKKINLKQLQDIFTEADDNVLTIVVEAYNKYMKEFGMNTCWNKAHFFAQASIEVGKSFTLKDGEILNYSARRLIQGDYSSDFVKGNLGMKKGGYFTKGKFHTRPFAYFDNHKNEAEIYGRKDLNKNNDKIIQSANEEIIANLVYGPNSAKGKELGNIKDGDGSRFIGRGVIQLTGRTNYTEVEPSIKKFFPLLDILTDEGVKNIGKNIEIAVLSSMAHWSGVKKINKVSNGQENVDKVSRLIGTDVDWKGKAKSFKDVTSDKFHVKECKWGKTLSNGGNDKGTVVVVSGKSTKLGDVKSGNKQWPVYKTTVYRNMSLETYNKLEKENKLPDSNYTTYLTRDAHSASAKDRSIKRYGSSNEAPPGTYYLNKGIRGQKYDVYLGDQEGGCSITGVDGWRGGIAIHGGFPSGTEGCLTTHTLNYGNKIKRQAINIKVKELIDNIPDFDDNTDDRPVRLILKERQVTKEGKLWNGKVE